MIREETHAILIVKNGRGYLTRQPGRAPKELPIQTRRKENLDRDARDLADLLAIRRNRFPTPPISMKMIALATGQHFGVSFDAIRGVTKNRKPLLARLVSYYLCRTITKNSYPQIGQFFGKDHTCPLRAFERIGARVARGDNELISSLQAIKEVIGE